MTFAQIFALFAVWISLTAKSQSQSTNFRQLELTDFAETCMVATNSDFLA